MLFCFSDMVILNSSYVTIMNSCPSDKTSQEYAKWTYELMKVAKLTDDSYEETRNISTCAKYLSVRSHFIPVRFICLNFVNLLSPRLHVHHPYCRLYFSFDPLGSVNIFGIFQI